MGNREEVNTEVMGDEQGIEVNQSTTTRVCAESRNAMFDILNTLCRLSFSKLKVALMIALAKFAILMAKHSLTCGKAFCYKNIMKNITNKTIKTNVGCLTNKFTLNSSVPG